jgi:hypothetical protein
MGKSSGFHDYYKNGVFQPKRKKTIVIDGKRFKLFSIKSFRYTDKYKIVGCKTIIINDIIILIKWNGTTQEILMKPGTGRKWMDVLEKELLERDYWSNFFVVESGLLFNEYGTTYVFAKIPLSGLKANVPCIVITDSEDNFNCQKSVLHKGSSSGSLSSYNLRSATGKEVQILKEKIRRYYNHLDFEQRKSAEEQVMARTEDFQTMFAEGRGVGPLYLMLPR